MKEKIASLVAEGIDQALQEIMPMLDERFAKADERMLERVNLAADKIKTVERGLPDPEAIREAVYGALKGQLNSLNLNVETIQARVDVLRELRDGEPGRDGLDGRDGKDGKDSFAKDGRDGKDGLDGRDGLDGTFRAAVGWEKDKEYAHGTVATHRNGVWFAERATSTEPSDEASGWIMLADGLHDIEAVWDHEKDIREFKLYIQMASGETVIHEMRVPFTQYREVWTDGEKYEPQDMVTMNGSLWMCLRDTDEKPGTDAGVGFWKLAVKRGADGKDGRRGEMGPMGLQGEKGADGRNGKAGSDGSDGKDGVDGKDGDRGPRGAAGKDGETGAKGLDGRQGDHFKDVEIDMELRNLNLVRDDDTYLSIPLAKLGQGVEKAFQWQGTMELGKTYRPGDVVAMSPTKLIICLNETSSLPPATADSVRNSLDWDIFIWVQDSKGGGGKSIEIEDMWVLSEGIDIPTDLGTDVSSSVNAYPSPILIPENQVTIFGWSGGKYLYVANQRNHSVGVGGNYVTNPEDFYLLTETGITQVRQVRLKIDDNGGGDFETDFNLQDWTGTPAGAPGNGLHVVPDTAYYWEYRVNDNVYVWEGPKDVYVGDGGGYTATSLDFGRIVKGRESTGVETPIEQPAHGFAALQCIRWDGTAWVLANADDDTTLALGIVTKVDDVDNFTYASIGRYSIPGHGATADEWYFVSDTIPGGLTRIEPENSQPIVYVENDEWISVFPYRPSAEQIQSIGEAPEDGQNYVRNNGTWVVDGGTGGIGIDNPDAGQLVRFDGTDWVGVSAGQVVLDGLHELLGTAEDKEAVSQLIKDIL